MGGWMHASGRAGWIGVQGWVGGCAREGGEVASSSCSPDWLTCTGAAQSVGECAGMDGTGKKARTAVAESTLSIAPTRSCKSARVGEQFSCESAARSSPTPTSLIDM